MPRSLRTPLALAMSAAVLLTGCTDASGSGPSGAASPGSLRVLASFYPLQYVVDQVGGDLVTVTSLTPPGGEPHDVELSPRQVREVGEADVVVVLGGFQPSVDAAVEARRPDHLLDAASTEAVAEHLEEGATEDAASEDGDHAHDGDPHFWLDPTLLAAVAQDVAGVLGDADPEHSEGYRTRADAFGAQLAELDQAFAEGLADCDRRVIVPAHEAYGFLAERYELEQAGISGFDPEAEPSPARLREIGDIVAEHGVTTIFTEQLVNPKVAETLARDLGVSTAVLDPVEAQMDESTDYRGAMEKNLSALRAALGCR